MLLYILLSLSLSLFLSLSPSLPLPHLSPFHCPFLSFLKNPAVHRSIKPQILSTIGDIALSIGANFKAYLNIVFQILKQAAHLDVTVIKVCAVMWY